jgi:argininosuccinate synthase
MKSRGLYETPGGTVVVEALRALEELVLDRETRHYREHLGLTFAELVYDGRWFTPLREALWACAEKIAGPLSGSITVRLFKGQATAVKRLSPNSLYAEKMVSFEGEEIYSQKDAGGFIKLLSLPERIRALKLNR